MNNSTKPKAFVFDVVSKTHGTCHVYVLITRSMPENAARQYAEMLWEKTK